MEKIYINIHSFIDVITNSSTEIFMLDSKKAADVIREIIKEKEIEFPPESYGSCGSSNGHAYVETAEDWEISDMFGYIDEEEAVKFLKAKGYKVTKTKKATNYICIKAERGYMNPGLKEFINETFNVVSHNTDG